MERVARVLYMCVELLVPLRDVGMVSRMLVQYVDGTFRWVDRWELFYCILWRFPVHYFVVFAACI